MAEGRETTDAVAERPVELAYRPSVGDLASALRARARSTGAGRFQRRALVWTVAVAAVGALLSAAGSGRRDTPWPLYAGLVVFAVFMTAVPWLQARQLHRLAERQGDIRGTVDDTGIRLTTAHSSAILDWHLYPRYAETPELFVLLSADKSAVGVVVLPKRAVADPEDVDRLRAVLDRRLVRADAVEGPGGPQSRGRAVGRGVSSVGLLLLGLLLFFFAFAAVQHAAHPDRFPGIQNNTAPISAVMLVLGTLAVAGAWWLVRRMTAMRIVTAVLAVLVLLAGGAALYRVGPMLHCWGSDRIARGPDGAYACYDF
ncbi:YcxB family protein [Streptomyces sp. NBC_00873]|uniref:YcxB family protein n=1 Tax=unclassified Streptomyces TaxID=2593676 RepID=UPI0038672E6D|nr:YcxB family protein [Streptomyces sp. NBC_00873]WSY96891.1 YcxB family protein [Streptomyces sp. NBC_00873]WTA41336.1 YcxB family protein [Streptomyces sp. NBC_00842]WTA48561.1 YcxB family protein [Streptomyces sp. NBC_00842]